MPQIELINVNKFYGSQHICKGVNLSIEDGEFITLLGSSGCGKTTTLNMIAGLDEVSSGDILMDGKRVNDLEPINRDAAMVFQNYALYPHMTVADNMGFNLRLKKLPKAEIDERVKAAASLLDLGRLLDRYPSQLSGGQQQRVAIGRAIVRQPKVFLFDEPFSNLDAALRNRMRSEVKALHQKLGVTSIFVTHDQEEALSISDRIAIMRNGVVEQFGTPEDVYTQPATAYVAQFIGSPQLDLLDGVAETSGFRCGSVVLPLNAAQHRQITEHNGRVQAAVRAEHVILSDSGLAARIEDAQPVGPSTLVRLAWDGGALFARLNGINRLSAGSTVHFTIDPSHLMFFDRGTGHRIQSKESKP